MGGTKPPCPLCFGDGQGPMLQPGPIPWSPGTRAVPGGLVGGLTGTVPTPGGGGPAVPSRSGVKCGRFPGRCGCPRRSLPSAGDPGDRGDLGAIAPPWVCAVPWGLGSTLGWRHGQGPLGWVLAGERVSQRGGGGLTEQHPNVGTPLSPAPRSHHPAAAQDPCAARHGTAPPPSPAPLPTPQPEAL